MTDIATITTATTEVVPATAAQVGYLAELVKVREGEYVQKYLDRARFGLNLGLSKADASAIIDQLINCPKANKTGYAKKLVADDGTVSYQAVNWDGSPFESITGALVEFSVKAGAVTAAIDKLAAAVDKVQLTAPAFGYYEIDGQLYHWDVTGKDLSPRLRVLKMNPYATGGQKKATWRKVSWANFQGAMQLTATFTPYGGLNTHFPEKTAKVSVPKILLDGGAKLLSKADVAAKGKELSFCVRCGAELSDPISVANGIGPICASYWS